MAGDWMKIELEMPDKPEVHYIAGALNLDPDAVVGKLIRVWQWFNKHTEDGNAHGVTYLLVDRITGVTGFGEAMAFAGWLEQHDKILVMPKFDRHTSESAKKRALTNRRVAEYRQKNSNAPNVTKSVTREEKRRSKPPIPPKGGVSGFAEFWKAYPKKIGKGAAEKAYAKAGINGHLPDILTAIERARATEQWQRDHGQFIPHPATWLNQRRWEDEPPLPADLKATELSL